MFQLNGNKFHLYTSKKIGNQLLKLFFFYCLFLLLIDFFQFNTVFMFYIIQGICCSLLLIDIFYIFILKYLPYPIKYLKIIFSGFIKGKVNYELRVKVFVFLWSYLDNLIFFFLIINYNHIFMYGFS